MISVNHHYLHHNHLSIFSPPLEFGLLCDFCMFCHGFSKFWCTKKESIEPRNQWLRSSAGLISGNGWQKLKSYLLVINAMKKKFKAPPIKMSGLLKVFNCYKLVAFKISDPLVRWSAPAKESFPHEGWKLKKFKKKKEKKTLLFWPTIGSAVGWGTP